MTTTASPTIGLALSGGGALGVAHIPVLQAFDDLGRKPAAIAGVSIGSVIGAMYAAGMSGDAIREHFLHLGERPVAQMWKVAMQGALDFRKGFASVDAEIFANALLPENLPDRFEDLPIPLHVVASDFHSKQGRCFSTGPLRPAVAASIAIPGVFRPVAYAGRIYVDGGISGNLPLQHLPPVDLIAAVNVLQDPPSDDSNVPGQLEAAIGALRTMIDKRVREDLSVHPPDIFIEPPVRPVGARALWQIETLLADAEPARETARAALAAACAGVVSA